MPCMCGDSECPSCGLAQGTIDWSGARGVSPDTRERIERAGAWWMAHKDTMTARMPLARFLGSLPRWLLECVGEDPAVGTLMTVLYLGLHGTPLGTVCIEGGMDAFADLVEGFRCACGMMLRDPPVQKVAP
jgi:hypothetical protein